LTIAAAGPSARAGPGTIEVTDDRVFAPGGEALARRFAARVLSFAEVQSLALDPTKAMATLNYRLENGDARTLLGRLARTVAEPDAGLNETELPRWTTGEPVTLYRYSGVISIFEELNISDGYFVARHPALKLNSALAREVENRLRIVPGVFEAVANDELRIRFDPLAVAAMRLIRLAEAEILGQPSEVAASASQPVGFALANISLSAAALSDFVLPPITPISAGLLVLSNLDTFGTAADELRRGEIGLPLLYTSIVGMTLASGQFLSAALMFWFFRYWEQRYRRDVETGHNVLLDGRVGPPEKARVLTADGPETSTARIPRGLIETTVPERRTWALKQGAEAFARRAVAPTLLAGGAGLLVGDVTTAGAVLRPDYATGVGLATRLEAIHDARFAARSGAVIRAGDALERFAKTSWIFLDDHPALHHAVCDVAEVWTNWLDEAQLLPAMAAAGLWLGDERGSALARACRDRGLVVRRVALREISGDGVAIDFGDRLLRLRGHPVVAGAVPPPLTVQVDGMAVAGVRFARKGHPEAAEVVRRLQQGGLNVFLASERVSAKQLGIDQYCGNMSTGDKIQFLRSLRRQSVAAAYVGDCLTNAAVAREAHLSIDFAAADTAADAGWDQKLSDIALLAPSITSLPALCTLARDSVRRRKRARYAVVIPNLLCVAGALGFGLTPTAVVLISNFGTSIAYNGAKRSLRKATLRFNDPGCADDERAHTESSGIMASA
jgi:hypothetical protein